MALNTADEIIRFSRLKIDGTVLAEEIEDALAFASDMITFLAPEDDSNRSTRVAPLRKRAEAYLATSELYYKIAPFLGLTIEGKQILQAANISVGTDFPTPTDYMNAMYRAADKYRELGESWAARIQPAIASLAV